MNQLEMLKEHERAVNKTRATDTEGNVNTRRSQTPENKTLDSQS